VLAQAIVLHVNSDDTGLTRNPLLALSSISGIDVPPVLTSTMPQAGLNYDLEAFQALYGRSFMDCLRMSINASSSDSRDKLFGVLSLLRPRDRLFIPLDYSLEYEQVFGFAVLLCIAQCGNLRLLTYARLPADSNLENACTFGLKELQDVIFDRNPYLYMQDPSDLNFEIGGRLWEPRISVKMISTTTQRLETVITGPTRRMESVVQQISNQFPLRQILPRLKVRAHLIDISCEPRQVTSDSEYIDGIAQDIMLHMSRRDKDISSKNIVNAEWSWLGRLFQLPKDRDLSGETAQQTSMPTSTIFNQSDFMQFETEVDSLPKSTMFRTHYSVGFSTSNHIAGDHIFVLDGTYVPLMLRQVGPDRYRIVGHCYLWAAWELDYWSPGTHRGLWLERPFDLGEGTRMIEIY
jgi:hypothetical protein